MNWKQVYYKPAEAASQTPPTQIKHKENSQPTLHLSSRRRSWTHPQKGNTHYATPYVTPPPPPVLHCDTHDTPKILLAPIPWQHTTDANRIHVIRYQPLLLAQFLRIFRSLGHKASTAGPGCGWMFSGIPVLQNHGRFSNVRTEEASGKSWNSLKNRSWLEQKGIMVCVN